METENKPTKPQWVNSHFKELNFFWNTMSGCVFLMKLGALQLLMHILYNFVFPQFLQRSSIWLSTQQCTNLSLQALYTTTNQLLLHKHCIINVFLTIQQACDFIWIDWIVKSGSYSTYQNRVKPECALANPCEKKCA